MGHRQGWTQEVGRPAAEQIEPDGVVRETDAPRLFDLELRHGPRYSNLTRSQIRSLARREGWQIRET